VEVIVVDDDSTDASGEILACRGGEVRVVLQERQGQTGAFNAGVAIANGDIIMFLDADDVLAPGTAAAVATALVERQGGSLHRSRLPTAVIPYTPSGAPAPIRRPAGSSPRPSVARRCGAPGNGAACDLADDRQEGALKLSPADLVRSMSQPAGVEGGERLVVRQGEPSRKRSRRPPELFQLR
jgi:glycosyltransferase involved in cell wall biosynthesis